MTFVRQSLTAAALTAVVGAGALSILDTEPSRRAAEQVGAPDTGLAELLARHRCSRTGFGEGVIPGAALLRHLDGHLEVVSFDRGWASFTGDRPGQLVAVCLGERPRPRPQPG